MIKINRITRYGAVVYNQIVMQAPSAPNTDSIGEPKTYWYGGTMRGGWSGASEKSAMRRNETLYDLFGDLAIRTKALPLIISEKLEKRNDFPKELIPVIVTALTGTGTTTKHGNGDKPEFYSMYEIDEFTEQIVKKWETYNGNIEKFKKDFDKKGNKKKLLTKITDSKFTIDQILFGRMATDTSLVDSIEAAISVAVTISTNENNGAGYNDYDYIRACGEHETEKGSGSIFLGEQAINSNCMYRCFTIDLDQYYSSLDRYSQEDKQYLMNHILYGLARLGMTSLPSGKQHSYLSRSYPEAFYMYHTLNKSEATTLVTAFTEAIRAYGGKDIAYRSVEALSNKISDNNKRFYKPEHSVWFVTSDKYENLIPENTTIVNSVGELESALKDWIHIGA